MVLYFGLLLALTFTLVAWKYGLGNRYIRWMGFTPRWYHLLNVLGVLALLATVILLDTKGSLR